MSPLPEPPDRGAIWPPSTPGPEFLLSAAPAWPPVVSERVGLWMAPGPMFSCQSMSEKAPRANHLFDIRFTSVNSSPLYPVLYSGRLVRIWPLFAALIFAWLG